MSIHCKCGRPLDARHLHATHQYDAEVSVLELYTCRRDLGGCGNTRSVELASPPPCACKGCCEARAEIIRRLPSPQCKRCGASVETGHAHCAVCRDELAIRSARSIGAEFAALKRRHRRRAMAFAGVTRDEEEKRSA